MNTGILNKRVFLWRCADAMREDTGCARKGQLSLAVLYRYGIDFDSTTIQGVKRGNLRVVRRQEIASASINKKSAKKREKLSLVFGHFEQV